MDSRSSFYPIGYYTAYNGSFGNAISQILYPVDSLKFMSNPALLDNLLFLWIDNNWSWRIKARIYRTLPV
ncbi:competence-induced protein Ccs4 [Streptococcus infantis SK1302]|uniref:Competence-induced protein Ccs4 n=1 Tax=Streptococcus infantis SK1302 TaxID=871237 RepID=A0ABP2J4Z8_9STRE|nr:competence-induced protein Ccs4 [Streptococcus infantis SK1302]